MSAIPDSNNARRPSTLQVAGVAAGNLVEWFDWYTYSALALYFAPVFFPHGNTTAQLLNTAAVFAVGFLARPLGAWLLGAYADVKGRKAALTLSILMMSFGSLTIALTPGFSTIGLAAPVLLVIARLLQGLSVGGEYGASATYLTEVATSGRRGFYSSFQGVTGIMGQLAAVGVLVVLQLAILTPTQLQDWGWRIPFVIGAAGSLFALVLRRKLDETVIFQRAGSRRTEHPLRSLARHPRAVATVAGLTLGGIVAYYTYTTYAQKFLVNTAGLSKEAASAVSAATLFVYMILQPALGILSDRIGRRPLLITFGVLGTILTFPIMSALATAQSPFTAFLLLIGALVIVSCYTSVNAAVKAELFPTEVRALGVALPYAVTVSIFGGTAEYFALWLKNAGHEDWFYVYVSGCIFISLIVYLTMRDTRTRDLSA